MPKLTSHDLARLSIEVAEQTPEEWMEKYDVPFETLEVLAIAAVDSMRHKMSDGGDLKQVLCETIANSFLLGWEAAVQFAPRKREWNASS